LLVTVTPAVPLTEPLVALTVSLPVLEVEAVYSPLLLLMLPTVELVFDQVMLALMALPNWSLAAALNCCLLPCVTVAVVGETVMLVKVELTVTMTEVLVVLTPWELVTVTWNWYEPG
jgi:hypothetical protein